MLVKAVNWSEWKSDLGKCSLKKTCRIQLGGEATVKTAATLVKELAYQNKVSLCCIMKVI